MKKIFVIGFNKTGTTSLHFLFKNLGINSIHTTKPVMEIINKHDAFTDGFHSNFINYYNAKPDSLFILNTRPIQKWLTSRYKHAINNQFKDNWCWPVSDEKTNAWIKQRETHFQNILSFFKDKPNQLLIINIEKNGWEKVVSTFLQKEYNSVISFRNKRSDDKIGVDKMKIINNNVTTCLKNKGYTGNELLLKNTDLSEYGYVIFL
jgi:hypothetical protein